MGADTKPEYVSFSGLREDWYWSNEAMPRLVRQAASGRRRYRFIGFPRQWLPVFEWYRVEWRGSIGPRQYIPVFSDLGERALVRIINASRGEGSLRCLAEYAALCDGVVADFVHAVDHSVDWTESPDNGCLLRLTSWQAYGRPAVREVDAAIARSHACHKNAIAMPCSKTRPYDKSMTHRRLYRRLQEEGICVEDHDAIVITALGVLPRGLWEMPQVLTYDSGVADVYRLLCLARTYFRNAKYELVYDCLKYEPYSDVLRIVQREGLIGTVKRLDVCGRRRKGARYVVADRHRWTIARKARARSPE